MVRTHIMWLLGCVLMIHAHQAEVVGQTERVVESDRAVLVWKPPTGPGDHPQAVLSLDAWAGEHQTVLPNFASLLWGSGSAVAETAIKQWTKFLMAVGGKRTQPAKGFQPWQITGSATDGSVRLAKGQISAAYQPGQAIVRKPPYELAPLGKGVAAFGEVIKSDTYSGYHVWLLEIVVPENGSLPVLSGTLLTALFTESGLIVQTGFVSSLTASITGRLRFPDDHWTRINDLLSIKGGGLNFVDGDIYLLAGTLVR